MGKVTFAFAFVLLMALSACNATSSQAPATSNPTLASMNTAAVQTVAVKLLQLTLMAKTPFLPSTPISTVTAPQQTDILPSPSPEEIVPATATLAQQPQPPPSSPCNRAEFLGDVTIPDGTILTPGFTFTKTWRLRNSGSCSWSKDYHIIYVQGTPLGSSGDFPLQIEVPPGAEAQISLPLQAPMQSGPSETYWKIRSPDGQVFGIGENSEDPLWVKISVEGMQENVQEQIQDTPIVSTQAPDKCSPQGDPSFERKLYTLINGERTKRGLFLFILSPQLTELARAHSRDMAIYSYTDHINSDGDGLAERFKKNNVSSAVFSENLFHIQSTDLTPQKVEETWIYNEADQTNIFNVTFSQIGIGYMVCNMDPKEYYVTAIFSQPK
jgi:uncharacterized protein YkwD